MYTYTAVTVQFTSNTSQMSQVSEDDGAFYLTVEAVGDVHAAFFLPVTITVEGASGGSGGYLEHVYMYGDIVVGIGGPVGLCDNSHNCSRDVCSP